MAVGSVVELVVLVQLIELVEMADMVDGGSSHFLIRLFNMIPSSSGIVYSIVIQKTGNLDSTTTDMIAL